MNEKIRRITADDQPDAPTERPEVTHSDEALNDGNEVATGHSGQTLPAVSSVPVPQPAPAGVSDTAMLDWLERQYQPRLYRKDGQVGFIAGDGTVIKTGAGNTCRSAILAAMRAEKEKGT